MKKRALRIAILDMNNNVPNQGLRCIKAHVEQFLSKDGDQNTYKVFDVRAKNEIPDIADFDIFISSGGPGSPLPEGHKWESLYTNFLNQVLAHNTMNEQKKYLFLICHSFLIACLHWELATVNMRKSYSFGVMPVHKTDAGKAESLLKPLPNPFYVVDSRAWQVVQPKKKKLEAMGAKILNLEKKRPHIPLERAVMTIRFTDEIFGTQYHPEADAEGMRFYFQQEEKRQQIIDEYGESKYLDVIAHLDDQDKIMLTQEVIIPGFLRDAADAIRNPRVFA
ncbi:glutamine amidotransferase-related protein [Ascidiimonas sp. W6]|uniref:type 1 glutamine amidotransferase n=1 Tax=Ascidiimonas meishanensis TaxID=3128903 RepID=UPI0030EC2BFE